MRTLGITLIFLISLSWLSDGSEGIGFNKKLQMRRAFFTKRSFISPYEENSKYNCVFGACLSGLEECTEESSPNYQYTDDRKEVMEFRCVIQLVACATKCMINWKNL